MTQEFALIRRILAGGPAEDDLPDSVSVGPGDDCAVVHGNGIALSVDMSVENVHFRRDWLEPEEIGFRAAAAALSDLAAVAADPIGMLVALAVAGNEAEDMVPRIMDGARAAATACGAVLLGGDLTRTAGPMVIDVVAVGKAARPVLRSGARAGDSVWVTGQLGGAAAAVREWQRGRTPDPRGRTAFAHPTPRVAEAAWLTSHVEVTALIDLSDGLAGDIAHIAAASDVRITLDAAVIPVHPAARLGGSEDEALTLALSGGEDYELCFTASADAIEPVADMFRSTFALVLTRIGSVDEGSGVFMRHADGDVARLTLSGHEHFGGEDAD